MKTKICSKCKIEKSIDQFYKGNDKSGLYYKCKKCKKEDYKKYYQENKEEILEQSKKYNQENKEEISEQSKKYYQENKEDYKKYYQENREKINRRARERLKFDVNYKMSHYLRHRLRLALKGNSKRGHILELLGCSIEQLKQHLESQFTKGMSWSNYGNGWNGRGMQEWHIDHIKPCASFDLSKASEQRKCFNYTNLQPLWAEDNLRKGDKR
jgi:gas vesicle protein